MKQILSVVLVSALVLSATAFNLEIGAQIVKGFTFGLNYDDLNPAIRNCSAAINDTRNSARDAVAVMNSTEPEVFERAVATFGFNFAHSIRVCGKALRSFKSLLESVATEAKNLNQDALTTRLFSNLMTFNMKYTQLKNNLASGDFAAVGEDLAEIFKVFLYNNVQIPSRVIRQLDAKLLGEKIVFDLNATVLGVQGFIEEANTTIVVDHYTAFVNDTTTLTSLFPVLEQAIQSADFQKVVTTITTIYQFIGVVTADYAQLKTETVAFIQRDLPLFEDETKISKAVEALFLDLPTTLYNLNRITSSYKSGDYKELGHGTGGIYNQLRNGAIGNKKN